MPVNPVPHENLLLGKNGQIGHELRRSLLPLGTVVAPGRQEVDLADAGPLNAALEAQAPDLLVNAAAYTAVDKAESEPAMARAINTDAVRVLARYARDHGILLVHYSTDYVFDGAQAHHTSPATRRIRSASTASPSATAKAPSSTAAAAPDPAYQLGPFAHGGNFVKTILRLAGNATR